MTEENIGEIGQDCFKLLCSRAGLTANPATVDRCGWDFIVQVPASRGADDAPERTCKVQVKATSKQPPAADIKLSNWERMAKERTPWFVAFLVIRDGLVLEVFLVHIDQQLVEKALARISLLSSNQALSDVRMTLSASDLHKVVGDDQAALLRAFVPALGNSEDDYVAEKSKWIRNAGYEPYPVSGTLTLAARDVDTAFVTFADWAVGLREDLPLAGMSMGVTRFGVTTTTFIGAGGTGAAKLNVVTPLPEATVILSNKSRSESVRLKCEVRTASGVIPFLPEKYERLRLVGSCISVVVAPGARPPSLNVHLALPKAGEQTSLAELQRAGKAASIFSRAAIDGIVLEAELEGEHHALAASSEPFESSDGFSILARLCTDIAQIARGFELDPETMVDPGELFERALEVHVMAEGFRGTMGWFSEAGPVSEPGIAGTRVATVVHPQVRIGGQRLVAAFALIGQAVVTQRDDGLWVELESTEVRECFRRILPESAWDDGFMTVALGDAFASLEREGIGVIRGQRDGSSGK